MKRIAKERYEHGYEYEGYEIIRCCEINWQNHRPKYTGWKVVHQVTGTELTFKSSLREAQEFIDRELNRQIYEKANDDVKFEKEYLTTCLTMPNHTDDEIIKHCHRLEEALARRELYGKVL